MTRKWNVSLKFNNKKCPYVGIWFGLKVCVNPMSKIEPAKIVVIAPKYNSLKVFIFTISELSS